MRNHFEIENIEALRYCEGIEDVELRAEIGRLDIGDFVKLTFLPSTLASGETLPVQITGIQGLNFHGTLARKPGSKGLSKLQVGTSIAFTAAHIHSLPKGQRTLEQ